MLPVHDRKQNTLIPLIQKWIHPGSIIHSNCWKSYNKLSKLGYTHVTVNHSKEFMNVSSAACTNSIESDWYHAKVSMPRYGVHQGMCKLHRDKLVVKPSQHLLVLPSLQSA